MHQSKYGIINIKLKLLIFLYLIIKMIIKPIIIIRLISAAKILWKTKNTILQVVLKNKCIK